MGNCQATEAAAVVIQHPGGKRPVERIYSPSVTANEVMSSNPGHYVAQLVVSSPPPVRQYFKLLRPDDTLMLGQVYRLITFEDVMKEFAAKKCVKLGKLLKEGGEFNFEPKKNWAGSGPGFDTKSASIKKVHHHGGSVVGGGRGVARHSIGGGQWRPTLQSIAELEQ